MPWNDDEWAQFSAVISRGFAARDAFTDADAAVYRLLLDGVEPAAALQAVREIVLEGQALRPKPGEIVERIRRDRGAPTFAEALVLIKRAIRARPAPGARYDDDPEPDDDGPRPKGWRSAERKRRDAEHTAVHEALAAIHPLAAAFAHRQGVDRLRMLELDDPEYGGVRRHELEQAWNAHVAAFDGREVAALAAGGRGRGELGRLDPLAVLGRGAPPARALPASSPTRATTPEEVSAS